MREHTPGPWHAGHMTDIDAKCNCRSVVSEHYFGAIAVIPKRSDGPLGEGGNDAPPEDEAIANARLIAAAPDLLAALGAVMERFGPGTMDESVFAMATEALIKATGEP